MPSNDNNKSKYFFNRSFQCSGLPHRPRTESTRERSMTVRHSGESEPPERKDPGRRLIMNAVCEYLGGTYLPALQKDKAAYEVRKKMNE